MSFKTFIKQKVKQLTKATKDESKNIIRDIKSFPTKNKSEDRAVKAIEAESELFRTRKGRIGTTTIGGDKAKGLGYNLDLGTGRLTRQFKVDETTFKIFKEFNKLIGQVATQHQQLFETVEEKMKKLRLGLKSYRYFDQAKALADKLGIALNESILNESSSMALSVYSPENLASLLEDKVEQTREEKIAIAKRLLQEQASIN